MKLYLGACIAIGFWISGLAACGNKEPTYVYGSGGSAGASGPSGGSGGSGGSLVASGGSAGSISSGGSAGSGGSGKVCPMDANFVNLAAQDNGWVGCDPALTTDNPSGFQGSFYGYTDNTTCVAATNPCSAGTGCCMSGATIATDPSTNWGCGLGFELNASGGMPSVKQPYAGSVMCLDVVLSGSSGGNPVRLAYTHAADTTGLVAPYLQIAPFTAGWEGTLCFTDVTCPAWATAGQCAVTGQAYDLQVQVVGGSLAAPFNVCLTSVMPQGGGGGLQDLGQFCGAIGSATDFTNAGTYRIQNNVYGGGSQCITAKAGGGAAGFTIDSTSLSTSGDAPVAYPSIVYGWHYGTYSSGTPLPLPISSVGTANSSVAFTVGGGKFNAAYDIWVHPQGNPANPDGGLEIMIWLNRGGGANPFGTQQGSFPIGNTGTWQVWTGMNGAWGYVAYVQEGLTSWTGDLKPFLIDAVGRSYGGVSPSQAWNLIGVQFGFEIWNGAPGFGVTNFTTAVTGGSL